MKLNIANPTTGAQKLIVVEDERKLRAFYDKRMAQEVEGEVLGDEYKGYVFKITGGNDKQGFPMMQGVLQNGRVRLLLDKNSKCYRPRRTGERKRKSVRGCIVGPDLSVLSLVIVKKGDAELPGLTDRVIPRRLGPKRASKIRKLFNLSKDDDVKKYVVRRVITPKPPKEGEEEKPLRKRRPKTKAPKIQRLVTPLTLQRKRRLHAIKKNRAAKSKAEAAEYARLIAQRNTEKRAALHSKRSARASSRRSQRLSQRVSQKNSSKESTEAPKAATTTATPAKATAKTVGKTAAKPAAAKVTKAAVPPKDASKTAAKPASASKDAAKPAAAKASKPAAPAKASKPAAQKAAAKK